MKTALIYASKHGTTGLVAEKIRNLLIDDEVVLLNLDKQDRIELCNFGRIIIGSPLYSGSPLPVVRKFIEQNLLSLLQKEVGIFVCCMFSDKADKQINKGFPELLRNHARSIKNMGGEYRFEDMNYIERLVVKKISGTAGSVSEINAGNIELFVRELTADASQSCTTVSDSFVKL